MGFENDNVNFFTLLHQGEIGGRFLVVFLLSLLLFFGLQNQIELHESLQQGTVLTVQYPMLSVISSS